METQYEAMSVEALEAEIHSLGEQRDAIAQEQRAAHRVLNRKLTEQSASKKIASLSDAEKAALLQQLKAQSIQSDESVGTPGQ